MTAPAATMCLPASRTPPVPGWRVHCLPARGAVSNAHVALPAPVPPRIRILSKACRSSCR